MQLRVRGNDYAFIIVVVGKYRTSKRGINNLRIKKNQVLVTHIL